MNNIDTVINVCNCYENGKKEARTKSISDNPYPENTIFWAAWIYGWEYGMKNILQKNNSVH